MAQVVNSGDVDAFDIDESVYRKISGVKSDRLML